MQYWPNPAHKRETTEAGPPRWRPDKLPCPSDMTVEERNSLLLESIPVNPSDPRSRRYVSRRGPNGLELYDLKCTQLIDDEPEYHGHPATFVPVRILRRLVDNGKIEQAEYRRLVRRFGCP